MFKLIRNFLASKGEFNDGSGGRIEWRYFVELESRRELKHLVTHKLTKRRIQWDRSKMDVRLMAQTLSNSVAQSFKYLSDQRCKGFEGCEATAKFTSMMNNIFDCLNTKKVHDGNPFKSPLSRENHIEIFSLFDEGIKYIRSLKLNGQSVLKRRKKTGFKGAIICMINIKNIFTHYVESHQLKNIPTFHLTQDPLEALFSRVRYLNGSNDNPTVEQFMSAMRKLLVQSDFKSSESANCTDELNILCVPSTDTVKDTEDFADTEISIKHRRSTK